MTTKIIKTKEQKTIKSTLFTFNVPKGMAWSVIQTLTQTHCGIAIFREARGGDNVTVKTLKKHSEQEFSKLYPHGISVTMHKK